MQAVKFGYAGKWSPNYGAVQNAAYLVKSDPTPVGVEAAQAGLTAQPFYRVATNAEYQQAAMAGRLVWTANA